MFSGTAPSFTCEFFSFVTVANRELALVFQNARKLLFTDLDIRKNNILCFSIYHILYTATLRKVVEKVHATIPKGIVGVFEFTVLHRNLKE